MHWTQQHYKETTSIRYIQILIKCMRWLRNRNIIVKSEMLITKNVFCSYTRHVPYKAFTYIYSFRWIKESMLKMIIRAKIKNSHIKRINILSFPNWTLKHVCIFQPSGRSQVFCQKLLVYPANKYTLWIYRTYLEMNRVGLSYPHWQIPHLLLVFIKSLWL